MKTQKSHFLGLVGVSAFGLLFAGAVGGCSAAPEPTASDNVDSSQDDLSFPICAADRFCLTLPGSCPGPNVIGLCVTKPATCSSTSSPVCGCNGTTYANSCKASQAGTGVAKAGACPAPVDPCANVVCKGTDKCVPGPDGTAACVPDPCASIACKADQMCVAQPDGTAACVPNPCFNVVCKGAQMCVVRADGTGACVDDPCANVACKSPLTCVALPDGTAGCE
jgi:hypothetical protein